MRHAPDVGPLSDRAGAKGGIEPFNGSFADEGLTRIQAMNDDEFCLARRLRRQREERLQQQDRFRALLESFVRLH